MSTGAHVPYLSGPGCHLLSSIRVFPGTLHVKQINDQIMQLCKLSAKVCAGALSVLVNMTEPTCG